MSVLQTKLGSLALKIGYIGNIRILKIDSYDDSIIKLFK